MNNVVTIFILGAVTAVAPLFAFIVWQNLVALMGSRANAKMQVKMNESFLPIKKEETQQLRIIQEREFVQIQHVEKMGGEL